MRMPGPFLFAALLLGLAGCQSGPKSTLPSGQDAYSIVPASNPEMQRGDYKIGPLDVINVNVFQEPDLTLKQVRVDAAGNILFPLIGDVKAEGKTARELSGEIAKRLSQKYLVDPQVSVEVASSDAQRITVEGQVTEPGVYEISGSSTLLEALARAKSPTRVARLDQVVVFRRINGERAGALFDVRRIRTGELPDPELQGGDIVVVGYDSLKGGLETFLRASPILNVFRIF